jgi:hypothetical protein
MNTVLSAQQREEAKKLSALQYQAESAGGGLAGALMAAKCAQDECSTLANDPSISGTLENALGFMGEAEQSLCVLRDKLIGSPLENQGLVPYSPSVEAQSRELCNRLACLVGQIRTLSNQV